VHSHFSAPFTTREKFQKQRVDRFDVELQGLAHWYLAATIHKDNDFNVTMDQSRYAKSTFLEAAGIKNSNIPHDIILPINHVLTSKYLTTTPEESSEMQED
jgi:hypothetical protein